ncbi:MAG: methionine--tRNA ligase [Thermoanaerobaculia bacterium]|nr:methionine--tRNA ligase [Thermoanaerobaculia bacterium]
MSEAPPILVTSGLIYANGPIHLGHLVEAIYTDIWVRFQRLRGRDCVYVCADDAHGTATMLRAEAEGLGIDELIDKLRLEHVRDFQRFSISHDYYYTTHSQENRELTELIYTRLRDGGHTTTRPVRQFYDPEEGIFLADRYVKGTCPRCKSEDQNGDNCDNCGATYTPMDLIDPRSAISGATPVEKESEHYFVKLGDFEDVLREWVSHERLQSDVVNKLEEWFAEGLHDWDISRDEPYFGFEIPDAPGKYFYVWVDAPIGYMASFRKLCEERGLDFDATWSPDSDHEVYHFIGKDIVYHHCLYWPAMLHGAGFRMPTSVRVHGFLTVNGQKMSKSRGTQVDAETYLAHLDPDYLRYYYAAKLGPATTDIDLNLEDFVLRVNSDLVGKMVNIASRCSGFLHRGFEGRLGSRLDDAELVDRARAAGAEIAELFEGRDYNRAMRRIMAVADEANRYIDDRKPWEIARDDDRRDELQAVLTTGIELFRILAIYLKPVVPATIERAEGFLGVEDLCWADLEEPLLDHPVARYEALMTRLSEDEVSRMIEDSKESAAAPAEGGGRLADDPIAPEIQIDDFAKLDFRVARIVSAGHVEGADKLLELRLDLGGEERTVFAGIKSAYEPADLEGRLTIVVANLAPRKMRFGTSEGMVLAAGGGGSEIFLLRPDEGAEPGMRIH